MENRRRSKRARTSIRGYVFAYGRRVRAQIRNLSEKGALILVDTPLMEGTDIEIDFNLKTDTDSEETNPFQTTGQVVWCNEDMDCGYQSGIHFNHIDDQSADQLTNFLETIFN